jgi:hypothetical protein
LGYVFITYDLHRFGPSRSGTSLMMQMLAAGGMPVLTDGERQADVDNPKAIWVGASQANPQRTGLYRGSPEAWSSGHLKTSILPAEHEYRIIFMQRHWQR